MRYEEPSSMVRWDSPLFTVSWDDEGEALERILGEIWSAVTSGTIKKANPSVVPVRSLAFTLLRPSLALGSSQDGTVD